MKIILRQSFSLLFLVVFLMITVLSVFAEQPLLTVAESSEYTKTSLYSDVTAFIAELQKRSPWIRVETICHSTEGREIPLLVIGTPLPASPLDMRFDERMVVYFQANIHAGEVEGKEAVLMLARDILLDADLPFLNDLVILIAPIFNADGN